MTGTMRGADIVARSLKRLGCHRVFTLSGNHIMSIFDAALDADLDLVHVRHEAAAVHMADAHGRLRTRASALSWSSVAVVDVEEVYAESTATTS